MSLDLDAIKKRHAQACEWTQSALVERILRSDIPALVAEVERLRKKEWTEAERLLREAGHRRRFEACRPTALARGLKVERDAEHSDQPLSVLVAEEIEAALAAAAEAPDA